jgi:hypothetical protein
MTKQDAQVVLLRAFIATGELSPEIEALLKALLGTFPPETHH